MFFLKKGYRFLIDRSFRIRIIAYIRRGAFWRRMKARSVNALLKLVAIFPWTNSAYCPVCGWKGYRFESVATWSSYRSNARCPACGALSRHRALIQLLTSKDLINAGSRCLHVGPSKSVGKFLRERKINYFSIDLNPSRAQLKMDVQCLMFPSSMFHLIICFHVLEFVPDWRRALNEFRRVIRPDGSLLLAENYLFGQPETIEHDVNKLFPGVPPRRFGNDLPTTLEQIGFQVEIFDYLGFNDERGDYFFICTPE